MAELLLPMVITLDPKRAGMEKSLEIPTTRKLLAKKAVNLQRALRFTAFSVPSVIYGGDDPFLRKIVANYITYLSLSKLRPPAFLILYQKKEGALKQSKKQNQRIQLPNLPALSVPTIGG